MDRARYRAAEGRLWSGFGLEPEEVEVRLARLGVDVRIQVGGTGPPVLFVHGAPNAGAAWAPLVADLAGFRWHLLDRPGTGLSGALPAGRPTERILDLGDSLVVDTLDALELDRSALVASSFGGGLALRSAAAHPDRVTRMVLMAPAPAPGMTIPSFMRMLTTPLVGPLVRRLPPSRRGNRGVMRQMGHGASLDAGRFPEPFLDWYMALQRHTDTMRHDGALVATGISRRGFAPEIVLTGEILQKVKAPTLVLWGADDGFGGPDVGSDLVDRMPDATLEVVERAGHLPWLDDPVGAAAATASWLSRSDERQAD